MLKRVYRWTSVLATIVGVVIIVGIGIGTALKDPWARAAGPCTVVLDGHRVWCDWDPAKTTLDVRGRQTGSEIPDDATADEDEYEEVELINGFDGSSLGTMSVPKPRPISVRIEYATVLCLVPLDARMRCQRALLVAKLDKERHLVPQVRSYASGKREIAVSLWTPLALSLGVVALTAVLARRRRLGCCRKCGYNLTGNVSGVCPECGTRIPPVGKRTPEEQGFPP